MMAAIRSLFGMRSEVYFSQGKGIMFALTLMMVSLLMYPNNDFSHSTADYYDGRYTHIRICCDSNTAYFYQFDFSGHPVFSDTIARGKFEVNKIFKNFYILKKTSDIDSCWNDMVVKCNPSETERMSVRFDIPRLKGDYQLQAYGIGRDSIFQATFSNNDPFLLLPDSVGYEFALIPHDNPMKGIPRFLLGFNNTIKFMVLPKVDGDIFKENNQIEICIPHLEDNIFDFWNIDGDLLMIDNDKIKWNGNEFKRNN